MNSRLQNLLLAILLAGSAAAAQAADVAIVVNKENPVDELSMKELRAIFELQQQFWKNGNRVSLVTQQAGQPEKKLVLRLVYGRTEDALNRYWMNRMFKAEIAAIPKPRASNDEVKQVISRLPNGIGFIDASAVDATVKVLRIDGHLPGDVAYALHADDAT
jgi:ABC-type phosphate transport system substrate-binding protein